MTRRQSAAIGTVLRRDRTIPKFSPIQIPEIQSMLIPIQSFYYFYAINN